MPVVAPLNEDRLQQAILSESYEDRRHQLRVGG
jgi:hypothetical protein